jgi:hypothetical protein
MLIYRAFPAFRRRHWVAPVGSAWAPVHEQTQPDVVEVGAATAATGTTTANAAATVTVTTDCDNTLGGGQL